MTPPQKILVFLHLKWLILEQIQLYFNRNVRQFTDRTTTVTCIHVLVAAEGLLRACNQITTDWQVRC